MATVRMSVAFYYIQSDLPKRTSGCHVADLFGAPADHYGRIDTQLQSRLLDTGFGHFPSGYIPGHIPRWKISALFLWYRIFPLALPQSADQARSLALYTVTFVRESCV